MASNYMAIYEENRESYGTKGAQKSGRLAADLYDDRTHFIFELLQNAEDSLGRRMGWLGERKIEFALSQNQLRFSHFGKPFDEADVRSVCEIAESTKDESSIGRFGLGFQLRRLHELPGPKRDVSGWWANFTHASNDRHAPYCICTMAFLASFQKVEESCRLGMVASIASYLCFSAGLCLCPLGCTVGSSEL